MSKILIVEDNDLNLKLFHDLLIIRNCEVLISRDGIGILNLVLQEKPDLVLMDIQLNDISGIDLIVELKNDDHTKSIPIIAVTAFAMKNDIEKISQSGCDMYLLKPVSVKDFFKAIDQFIKPIK